MDTNNTANKDDNMKDLTAADIAVIKALADAVTAGNLTPEQCSKAVTDYLNNRR